MGSNPTSHTEVNMSALAWFCLSYVFLLIWIVLLVWENIEYKKHIAKREERERRKREAIRELKWPENIPYPPVKTKEE